MEGGGGDFPARRNTAFLQITRGGRELCEGRGERDKGGIETVEERGERGR